MDKAKYRTNVPGGVFADPINSQQHHGEGLSQASQLKPFMRVVLDEMPEDPDPIKPGSQGTVVDADSLQILVDWDEDVHRSLHLIPGVDRYHVVDPDSTSELEKSWLNLASIQDRVRSKDGGEDSRCPRCGQLFDLVRGAVSRRIRTANISICNRCGTQEAIEDFVINGRKHGVDVDVTVPKGRNKTGFETEPVPAESGNQGSDGKSPTVSNDLDSHSDSATGGTAEDIDNIAANSVNNERAAGTTDEECVHKEKLKIDILPTSDWYITRIWTGKFETSRSEQEVAR